MLLRNVEVLRCIKDKLLIQKCPGFPKYELFGRGGLLGVEEHFPLTNCHSWLLPQLAATIVVLLSVEHSKTTTNSSDLEMCLYVGNP